MRVRDDDKKFVTDMLKNLEKEFSTFIKDNLKQDKKVTLKMYPQDGLSEEKIGGVILYCNNFRIVFDNTLKIRLQLIFDDSIPDIRKIMFKSLAN